jgi:CMP-N-acetylneuraminic acid synthetase
MKEKLKIAALVPMRHRSIRVPGKNYRPLAGKPLFHYILSSLQSCPDINEIIVDTDSPELVEGIEKNFSDIQIIERPENLRADTIPMNEILLYDTSIVKADLYLQTHSTNPLLSSKTISSAISTYLKLIPAYDSLFSVTRIQTRLWDQLTHPVNHDPAILLRTQDLPPLFEENSCIYLFNRETLLDRKNRIGKHPFMYEMERDEAFDIDEEFDFLMAELMIKHRSYSSLV